jgi:hypothetical protein
MVERVDSFVVECFWPDVRESELAALDRRVRSVTDDLARRSPVRYLGSILMRQDEVVLYQFEGSAEVVREAAERAGVPYERIVETSRSSPSP